MPEQLQTAEVLQISEFIKTTVLLGTFDKLLDQ